MGLGDWLSSLFGKGEKDEEVDPEPAARKEPGPEKKADKTGPEKPRPDRGEESGPDF